MAVGGPLLAVWQQRGVGGPLLAGWPRDPWLRPEPGSQEVIFTGPGSRPEALLIRAERIRCQAKPHVARARPEVQPGRGCTDHEVQSGRERIRCQAHHRLESTACRLSTDRHVQGRQTNRPGHRVCAASAWLSAGKVRSLDTCTRPGLIPRCQVTCTETKARGRDTCATSAWLSVGKVRSPDTCARPGLISRCQDYVYRDAGTGETRALHRGHVSQTVTCTRRLRSAQLSRRHVEETRALHRGSASEPQRKPGQVGPAS